MHGRRFDSIFLVSSLDWITIPLIGLRKCVFSPLYFFVKLY